jgi:hypothetical protein
MRGGDKAAYEAAFPPGEDIHAAYAEWRAGFPSDVLEKFESGEFPAPY